MSDRDHPRRPGLLASGGRLRPVLLILLTYAVLGALAGVVWEWVWTPPGQVIDHHQVLYDSYASLRRVFTGTGLYALVAAVTSALVALAVTMLSRGRELLVLALVVVGSALAAALMWRVGTLLGPGDPAAVAAHTAGHASVHGQLEVAGKSPYLVWPMTSLFVLALVYFAVPSSFPGSRSRDPGEPAPAQADALGASRPDHREGAAAAETGGHDVAALPADRQRVVDEIRSVRFKTTRIRTGYDMGAVDALLDRAAAAVRRGESLTALLDTSLPTVTLREGYDRDAVGAFVESLRKSADAPDARG